MSEKEVSWEYDLVVEKLASDKEGNLYIAGYASNDAEDEDGEVMDMQALKGIFDTYMTNPVVKFMHDKAPQWKGAIGRVVKEYTDIEGETHVTQFTNKPYLVIKLAKGLPSWLYESVKDGTYKGLSIGGRLRKRLGNRLYLKSWLETSLVDVPSAKGSFVSVLKSAGANISEEDVDNPVGEPNESNTEKTPTMSLLIETKVGRANKKLQEIIIQKGGVGSGIKGHTTAKKPWEHHPESAFRVDQKVLINPDYGGGVGIIQELSPSGKYALVKTKEGSKYFSLADLNIKDYYVPKPVKLPQVPVTNPPRPPKVLPTPPPVSNEPETLVVSSDVGNLTPGLKEAIRNTRKTLDELTPKLKESSATPELEDKWLDAKRKNSIFVEELQLEYKQKAKAIDAKYHEDSAPLIDLEADGQKDIAAGKEIQNKAFLEMTSPNAITGKVETDIHGASLRQKEGKALEERGYAKVQEARDKQIALNNKHLEDQTNLSEEYLEALRDNAPKESKESKEAPKKEVPAKEAPSMSKEEEQKAKRRERAKKRREARKALANNGGATDEQIRQTLLDTVSQGKVKEVTTLAAISHTVKELDQKIADRQSTAHSNNETPAARDKPKSDKNAADRKALLDKLNAESKAKANPAAELSATLDHLTTSIERERMKSGERDGANENLKRVRYIDDTLRQYEAKKKENYKKLYADAGVNKLSKEQKQAIQNEIDSATKGIHELSVEREKVVSNGLVGGATKDGVKTVVENLVKKVLPGFSSVNTNPDIFYTPLEITPSKDGTGYLVNATYQTGDRGLRTDMGYSDEDIGASAKPFKDKWQAKVKDLEKEIKLRGLEDHLQVYLDYGEKGHIAIQVAGRVPR